MSRNPDRTHNLIILMSRVNKKNVQCLHDIAYNTTRKSIVPVLRITSYLVPGNFRHITLHSYSECTGWVLIEQHK